MKTTPRLAGVRPSPDFLMGIGALLGIAVLSAIVYLQQLNLVAAIGISAFLILVSLRSKSMAIVFTMAYLVLLGDIRRIANMFAGAKAFDLLLLVGPIVVGVLTLPLFFRLRLRDNLSKAMLALLFIMIMEIFNPRQGGIAVGLSGAVFYIVPVLWFWVGRRYGTPQVVETLIYRAVVPLAVAAALLGLAQNYIGFLPWEQEWLDTVAAHYSVLRLAGGVRAFGFSVSSAEYAVLVLIGASAAIAAWVAGRRVWALALIPVLPALILSSNRGVVVKLILAIAVVLTFRSRKPIGAIAVARLAVLAVGGLLAIALIAQRFQDPASSAPTTAAQGALSHQVQGLANPLDQKKSTAGIHGLLVLSGVAKGFTYPIGTGLGSLTGAGAKLGADSDIGSSEIDISDMFIVLGFVGGSIYLFAFVTALRYTAIYTRLTNSAIGLPVLAILVGVSGSWLTGGQYSTAAICLFMIGSVLKVVEPSLAVNKTEPFRQKANYRLRFVNAKQ
jgi:hypothetical protein